ncbi:peptide-methionine (S)-S-oxide reductase MsrA [Bacteriovoracales bacterium]|nr:peptide-methionine (S)-S-oxide reductase MsrA [Bacteriovoracales bacterium]
MSEKFEEAIFAGGCFWGMEYTFKKLKGVHSTKVGYIGGQTPSPTYESICRGDTEHAEAIKITFDPKIVSYSFLLNIFFRLHDPTTLNKQKNDVGTQYRSAIFYFSEDQKKAAYQEKEEFDQKGGFEHQAVTEITKAPTFFEAENYHQDYLNKNPLGYNCHFLREDYKKG